MTVQSVMSRLFFHNHCLFFLFTKKKHWTGNLSFCESGLKNLFCWDFYSTPVLTVHFILFLFPFLFLFFFLLLVRFCHLAVTIFFFCRLDFGIAACAPLDVDQTVWTGDIITSWNEKSDLNPLCWLCLHFGPKSPFLGAKCDRWPDKQFVMHHFVLSAQELSTDQLLCPLLETAFAIVFTQKSPLRSFGIFFPWSLALVTMVWVFSSTNTPNIPAQHLVLKSL